MTGVLLLTSCGERMSRDNRARDALERYGAEQIECEGPDRMKGIKDRVGRPAASFCSGYVSGDITSVMDLDKGDGSIARFDVTDNVKVLDEALRRQAPRFYDYCKYEPHVEVCFLSRSSSGTGPSKHFLQALSVE